MILRLFIDGDNAGETFVNSEFEAIDIAKEIKEEADAAGNIDTAELFLFEGVELVTSWHIVRDYSGVYVIRERSEL